MDIDGTFIIKLTQNRDSLFMKNQSVGCTRTHSLRDGSLNTWMDGTIGTAKVHKKEKELRRHSSEKEGGREDIAAFPLPRHAVGRRDSVAPKKEAGKEAKEGIRAIITGWLKAFIIRPRDARPERRRGRVSHHFRSGDRPRRVDWYLWSRGGMLGLSQSDSTDHELLGKRRRPGRKEAWMALACGTSDGIALSLSRVRQAF